MKKHRVIGVPVLGVLVRIVMRANWLGRPVWTCVRLFVCRRVVDTSTGCYAGRVLRGRDATQAGRYADRVVRGGVLVC